MTSENQNLVEYAAKLKGEIDAKKAEYDALIDKIVALATFKNGSHTGHCFTSSVHCKVTKKEYVKWDQSKLNALRAKMEENDFFSIFGWEYKPVSKAVIDHFLASDSPVIEDIRAAMTITEGKPQLVFESLNA